MHPFSFATTAQLICEPGSAKRLASLCREREARSVLIVTDPGITRLGLLDRVLPGFAAEGVEVAVYDQVLADPPESVILAAVEQARAQQAGLIVGFGGGSSMDVAKLVALLAHPDNSQTLQDIYGVGNAKGQRLPLIQVPRRRHGFGSDADCDRHHRRDDQDGRGLALAAAGPGPARCRPDARPAAGGDGGDRNRRHGACHRGLHQCAEEKPAVRPAGLRSAAAVVGQPRRGGAQRRQPRGAPGHAAGCLPGRTAFANAPVAAVHALAYPLGGNFHIPHGLSNALVLPHVLRFNLEAARPLYRELAPILLGARLQAGRCAAEQLIETFDQLSAQVGLPTRLRDAGVPEAMLPQLAREAMQQQRLLVNNPREVTEAAALAIYRAAY